MARIAGVDLPPKKRAEIGLTYIYGIGRTRRVPKTAGAPEPGNQAKNRPPEAGKTSGTRPGTAAGIRPNSAGERRS